MNNDIKTVNAAIGSAYRIIIGLETKLADRDKEIRELKEAVQNIVNRVDFPLFSLGQLENKSEFVKGKIEGLESIREWYIKNEAVLRVMQEGE